MFSIEVLMFFSKICRVATCLESIKQMRIIMYITTRNNQMIQLRQLSDGDTGTLVSYLSGLSTESRKRFGPHPFDWDSVEAFYRQPENRGYVAVVPESGEIIAYAILRSGFLLHDSARLESYGLTLNHNTDCTFAPSVADSWQNCGIGDLLFQFIRSEMKENGLKRIILWGGVQADNDKAVNFYRKNGFQALGCFEYNGLNLDMALELK